MTFSRDISPILARILILTITLLGVAVILSGLDSKGLWGDELAIVSFAGGTLADLFTEVVTTGRNPTWFWSVVHFFTYPPIDFLVRYPPAFFGIFAIPAIYQMGRIFFSRRIGLLAALLLALSALHVAYAQEVREYSALVAFSILTATFLQRWLTRPSRANWLLFTLCALLMVTAHAYGALPMIAMGTYTLFVFVDEWRHSAEDEVRRTALWRKIRQFAITAAIMAVLWIPSALLLYKLGRRTGAIGGSDEPGLQGIYLTPITWDWDFVYQQLGWFSGANGPLVFIVAILFFVGAALWASRSWRTSLLLLLWFTVPYAAFTAAGVTLQVRYIIYLLPFFLLCIAISLDVLRGGLSSQARIRKSGRYSSELIGFASAALVAIAISVPPLILYSLAPKRQDYMNACRLLQDFALPGHLVISAQDTEWSNAGFQRYCQKLHAPSVWRRLASVDTVKTDTAHADSVWVFMPTHRISEPVRQWLWQNMTAIPFEGVIVFASSPSSGRLPSVEELELLERALEYAPGTERLHIEHARRFIISNRWDEAKIAVNALLTRSQDPESLSAMLAETYLRQGKVDDAYRLFALEDRHSDPYRFVPFTSPMRRAREPAPDPLDIAEAAVLQPDLASPKATAEKQRLQMLREAVEASPTSGPIHLALGEVHLSLAQSSGAEQANVHLAKARKMLDQAEKLLATTLMRFGRVAQWSEAGEHKATQFGCALFAAQAKLADLEKRTAQETQYARKAVICARNNADYRHILGKALAGQGRHKEAAVAYAQAVALNPGIMGWHLDLARAYRDANRTSDALDRAEYATESFPGKAEPWILLGNLLAASEDSQAAYDAFTTAWEIAPENVYICLRVGEIEEQLGKIDEAITQYAACAVAAPDSRYGKQAQARLDELQQQPDLEMGGALTP